MRGFEELYKTHGKPVYRFLLTLTGDAHQAEELLQETFYQAFLHIDRFEGRSILYTWLCQIGKHLWYQHLRTSGREASMPEELPDVPVPSAEEGLLAQESRLTLLKQIHALPELQKEVVYLRAFGGLSFREIGDVLGKTETWARVTFYRSKERLKNGGDSDEK